MKPEPKRPDIRSPACQNALSELAQSLATYHDGAAAVIVTSHDGVAIQAVVADAVDALKEGAIFSSGARPTETHRVH